MKRFFRNTFTVLYLALCAPLFAAGDIVPAGMKSLAQNIYDTMTSDFVKIILACFLCGSAITYAFNKDNEKIKRNTLAIGIGAAILIAASSIVDLIWSASK